MGLWKVDFLFVIFLDVYWSGVYILCDVIYLIIIFILNIGNFLCLYVKFLEI